MTTTTLYVILYLQAISLFIIDLLVWYSCCCFCFIVVKGGVGVFYKGFNLIEGSTPFNFCLGNRSAGKTYFFKKYVIDKFNKLGHKFIYMRRFKTELDVVAPNLFADVSPEVASKEDTIYYKGKECGKFISLSSCLKYKSVNMSDYEYIIFDEFLPEDGRYLKPSVYTHEPNLLLNFYQSVARGYGQPIRESVKVVLISNTVSTVNPYFNFFNLEEEVFKGKTFIKNDFITLEIVQANVETISKSKFGQFIQNLEYGQYALSNSFYLDNEDYIYSSLPPLTRENFNILILDDIFTLFNDEMGNYYLAPFNNNGYKTFSVFNKQGYINLFSTSYAKLLRNLFLNNRLFFCNQKAKAFINLITTK